MVRPILFNTNMVRKILDGRKTVTRRLNKCPYRVNDILYVRETWCWCPCWDCGMDSEEGCCDKTADKFYNHNKGEMGCYGYKASFEDDEQPFDRWYPSIHMPKEAARIFLKVMDVRVERLQDITDIEAEKEGAQPQNPCDYDVNKWPNKEHFKEIWNSTIKKSDLDCCGWDANPWVWVIEFEQCEKPQGWERKVKE
ncbi:MAG: hypothetical protein HFJ06_03120 [Lachnospiraceae bacterium]|nr:hypothetical protein [Lachnospiraceae bacterium]